MSQVEFIVVGTPRSLQAKSASKSRWKAQVLKEARRALPSTHSLFLEDLRATIYYFHVNGDLDVDNILKPILDAMVQVVFLDDAQIIDVIGAKRGISGSYVLSDVSPVLVGHLAGNPKSDFVFVSIEATDERSLP